MQQVKDGLPTNVEADALSQIPRHTQMMDIPTVKAIIKAIPYTD